jgi:hypothetical protein
MQTAKDFIDGRDEGIMIAAQVCCKREASTLTEEYIIEFYKKCLMKDEEYVREIPIVNDVLKLLGAEAESCDKTKDNNEEGGQKH